MVESEGARRSLERIEDLIKEIKNILEKRGHAAASVAPTSYFSYPGGGRSGKTMKAKKGKRIGGIGHSSRGPKKPIRKGKLTKKKKSRGKR